MAIKREPEDIIKNIQNRIKPENRQFVDKNLDIAEQVNEILEKKGWTQKTLAQNLNKSESEISKWLTGLHNLTLKTITNMETVLGEDIIVTPQQVAEKRKKTDKYFNAGAKENEDFMENIQVKEMGFSGYKKTKRGALNCNLITAA